MAGSLDPSGGPGPQPLFLDNTVLANFALVGRSDLLKRLWGQEARVTAGIRNEFFAGVASDSLPAGEWPELDIVELTEEERQYGQALPLGLGAGERSSLAAAVHRHGILVSDDRKARTIARNLGVETTGTIGILLRCIESGLLTMQAGNQLLERMIAEGYWSPVVSLDRYLGAG